MWGDSWSFRWNLQMFAAPGYVVLMINRRGSTGYGQAFTDEVVNDWGGKAYADIMSGIEATVREFPFVDGSRVAAAGGSYGGYMADWLATHTGRFKAIVSHAGVYDVAAMYASDVPWFTEFEMHGTPWESEQTNRQWSPSEFAAALGKFKTPMLVIAGEKDYRVPFTQSLELFATLQRQGVPSKLVVFPDEGHWVLKPKDSQLWNQVVFDWLGTYLK
jgi:dipeptidyl aminopeptidase/acylaminoacyl peptidase